MLAEQNLDFGVVNRLKLYAVDDRYCACYDIVIVADCRGSRRSERELGVVFFGFTFRHRVTTILSRDKRVNFVAFDFEHGLLKYYLKST